jgi:hypothetical protein
MSSAMSGEQDDQFPQLPEDPFISHCPLTVASVGLGASHPMAKGLKFEHNILSRLANKICKAGMG